MRKRKAEERDRKQDGESEGNRGRREMVMREKVILEFTKEGDQLHPLLFPSPRERKL